MQLPKTTPEQRAEIYQDVRKLLHPGFLAHSVDLNGVQVALRSLNDNDWFLLQYRVNTKSPTSWKRWTVAASIWMVDGQIILGDEGALHRVYQMCASLPFNILEDLYSILNALMRHVNEATHRMEGYLYEHESRYLWRSEGADLVKEGRLSSNGMGLNPLQKLWLFYNQLEDENERERHEWELAKFVAGPHVPKGIKKINAKDKQARADMKRKRESAMDRIYHEAQGSIPRREKGEKRKGRFEGWQVQIAETEEELHDEMRRWVAGIKDPHDNVIDYVKAKIKTEREQARVQADAQREALRRAMEEEGIGPTRMVPLTGKAAQEFIERVKSRVGGISKVTNDATHNSAYEKYIKNNPEVGVLRVDDQGNIVSDEPSNSQELLDVLRKPGAGSGPSLQDRIRQRRPSLETLYDDPEGGS